MLCHMDIILIKEIGGYYRQQFNYGFIRDIIFYPSTINKKIFIEVRAGYIEKTKTEV